MRLSSLAYAAAFNFLSLPQSVLSEAPPYENEKAFDKGSFGAYPTQEYKSSDAIAPRLNLLQSSPECDDKLYTFFSPRGYFDVARNPRAVILDSKGALIWSFGLPEQKIYNLLAQRYRGNDYITFWAGNDAVGGHGAGYYYMLDRHYNITYKIGAARGLDGDLHEFRITERGTAVMTVYRVTEHDLTSLGKTVGPIWDCLIQEVDIETGNLVFEWSAGDNMNVADTYRHIGGEGNPGGAPFDWFHINSIDKDNDGNYLVSSRYLRCIAKIDHKTGKVIWILGGKSNMFKDLSGGKATGFAYQHDARWAADYTEVTMFDNSDDGSHKDQAHPRGLRIRIDQVAMTAELVTEYNNPRKFTADSQGSMQDLENGNVIVGFGYTGAYTEFDHNGTVLCDTHYGPQSQFGTGGVQSYRVQKFPWKGLPRSQPSAVVAQDDSGIWRAYVSWNGATEVKEWILQGTNHPLKLDKFPWKPIGISSRMGFETSIQLPVNHPGFLRFVAVGAKANVLGVSNEIDATDADVVYTITVDEEEFAYDTTPLPSDNLLLEVPRWAVPVAGAFGVLLVLGICCRPAFRAFRSLRPRRASTKYARLAEDQEAGKYRPLADQELGYQLESESDADEETKGTKLS